jgi:hypothetical protein
LFGDHDETFDPNTHIKVRVLSSKRFPTNLKTGSGKDAYLNGQDNQTQQ